MLVRPDTAGGKGSVVHELHEVHGGPVRLSDVRVGERHPPGEEPCLGGFGEALLRGIGTRRGVFGGRGLGGTPAVTGAGAARESEDFAWGAHGGVFGMCGLC